MTTEADVKPETEPKGPEKRGPSKIWKRLAVPSLVAAAAITLGLSIYSSVVTHKTQKRLDDLNFSQVVSDYNNSNDLVTPDLGVIQFMHKGFTISFTKVSYGSDGLNVSGTLGNPTRLTVSSLTLKLSARPYLYKVKDKLQKDPFFIYSDDLDIGSGQADVGTLFPGMTQEFSMTIPNVKQTPDGFQIAASFTGERYSY